MLVESGSTKKIAYIDVTTTPNIQSSTFAAPPKTNIRKISLHHPKHEHAATNEKAVSWNAPSVRCRSSDVYFGLQINRIKSQSTNHESSSNHPATKSLLEKKEEKSITQMHGDEPTQQCKHCNSCNPLNRRWNIRLSIKRLNGFFGSKRNCGGNDKETVECDLRVPTRPWIRSFCCCWSVPENGYITEESRQRSGVH